MDAVPLHKLEHSGASDEKNDPDTVTNQAPLSLTAFPSYFHIKEEDD